MYDLARINKKAAGQRNSTYKIFKYRRDRSASFCNIVMTAAVWGYGSERFPEGRTEKRTGGEL